MYSRPSNNCLDKHFTGFHKRSVIQFKQYSLTLSQVEDNSEFVKEIRQILYMALNPQKPT